MIQVLYGNIEPCSCSVEPFCVNIWLDSYCIFLVYFSDFMALGNSSSYFFDGLGWTFPQIFVAHFYL